MQSLLRKKDIPWTKIIGGQQPIADNVLCPGEIYGGEHLLESSNNYYSGRGKIWTTV